MADVLSSSHNFRSLSLRDLLKARELYHFHLLNKANVVGTAVGLYLIRKSDPPHKEPGETKPRGKVPDRSERTFSNSEVRDDSWPCVLVLVREWSMASEFGTGDGKLHPDEMVPRTLYMPDGRMVPVCVVKVEQGEPRANPLPDWHWPRAMFGPGMPITVTTQGRKRMATAGCLVTDGHTLYALSSQHVTGAGGETVSVHRRGTEEPIGIASGRNLGRLPFGVVYPALPSRRTFVNADVGLIELEDVSQWTSSVYGLGTPGPIADLNEMNLTLRLIDAPVVGAGAASGRLDGRIKALFYRYKSLGGFDYVSDFLIAPSPAAPGEEPSLGSQPGDSGAVWHLLDSSANGSDRTTPASTANRSAEGSAGELLRPLAIQWGGQVFLEGPESRQFAFALATSLTTVCRELDVECVVTHNVGAVPYWGQTGHYSIATFAVSALPAPSRLETLLRANLGQISFSLAELTPQQISAALHDPAANGFVPLADVPDMIWKQHFTKVVGGRDNQWVGPGRSTGPEHPTHYADIDEERSDGQTLRGLCMADEANVSVDVWKQFYDNNGHTESRDRGLLPFRVWQFYDAMVGFLRGNDVERFVCAAGILSHYVGDACQPLHGSVFADGYPDGSGGKGVHSTYESMMIDRKSKQGELLTAIQDALDTLIEPTPPIRDISSGSEAAIEIVRLMDRTATTIPPQALVDAYIAAGENTHVATQDALWDAFGPQTAQVMADGARVLSRIWQGAWKAAGADALPAAQLVAISRDRFRAIYTPTDFVESLDLDDIAGQLQ